MLAVDDVTARWMKSKVATKVGGCVVLYTRIKDQNGIYIQCVHHAR